MKQVSVVMASCNPNYDLLKTAIKSVLCQTFKDFELIIIDDGSDLPIENFIKSITNDKRIITFRISNSGLGAALNFGISKSSGEYIARLDDDDLMLPNRLQRQVEFMNAHLDVSCVGTWFFDKSGNKIYPHRKYPEEHAEIVKSLLKFRFSLAHTTLMFRRNAFDKIHGYRIKRGGQDLDLELQMGTVGRLANIPEFLNCYTMSTKGLGTLNPQKYDAYIYALEDVVNRELYPDFRDITVSSINSLKRINDSSLKTIREKIIRFCLIMRIKLFGGNIDLGFLNLDSKDDSIDKTYDK